MRHLSKGKGGGGDGGGNAAFLLLCLRVIKKEFRESCCFRVV